MAGEIIRDDIGEQRDRVCCVSRRRSGSEPSPRRAARADEPTRRLRLRMAPNSHLAQLLAGHAVDDGDDDVVMSTDDDDADDATTTTTTTTSNVATVNVDDDDFASNDNTPRVQRVVRPTLPLVVTVDDDHVRAPTTNAHVAPAVTTQRDSSHASRLAANQRLVEEKQQRVHANVAALAAQATSAVALRVPPSSAPVARAGNVYASLIEVCCLYRCVCARE
jgi:hypothetical protein